MVLSLSATWLAEMGRSGVEPIYAVEIDLGPLAFLDVLDYAAGAGDTFTVTTDGGPITVTEGVDFTAATSNTATATAMAAGLAAAYVAAVAADEAIAFSSGSRVIFAANDGTVDSVTVATSDATAWAVTPEPIPRTVGFVSGARPLYGYAAEVESVQPVASAIDPFTRLFSLGDVEIVFADHGADGGLRWYLTRSFPRGKLVTISLGSHRLALADYLTIGTFRIDDFTADQGTIRVQCTEPASVLRDSDFFANLIAIHPLAAIREIMRRTGFASVDETSLDSTDAAYSAISHWAVSRLPCPPITATADFSNAYQISESTPGRPGSGSGPNALDEIESLLTLLNASLILGTDGNYAAMIYDPNAASVRTLTADDYDQLEVLSSVEHQCSRITIQGHDRRTGGGRQALYQLRDGLTDTIGGGEDTGQTIESDWLGGWGFLAQSLNTTSTRLVVIGAQWAGMSGSRPNAPAPAATQRAADQLTGGRVAHLMITNGVHYEIVTCSAYVTLDTYEPDAPIQIGQYPEIDIAEPLTGTHSLASGFNISIPSLGDPAVLHDFGEYTISARGAYGTTARAWPTPSEAPGSVDEGAYISTFARFRVIDVTIPIAMAEARISRFAGGCPIVRFRATLAHADLELGDPVAIESDQVIGFMIDGSDSDTVFEIVSKEIVPLDDSPGVVFTAAWMRDPERPAPVFDTQSVPVGPPGINILDDVITTISGATVYDQRGRVLTRR